MVSQNLQETYIFEYRVKIVIIILRSRPSPIENIIERIYCICVDLLVSVFINKHLLAPNG